MSVRAHRLQPSCELTNLFIFTLPLAQRDFEARLKQQLVDLDSSIRRNFDKLLAQHLGAAVDSICHAHTDAHGRLEGGLLDLAGIALRLEAKLDRLAESVQHSSPENASEQVRSGRKVQHQHWMDTKESSQVRNRSTELIRDGTESAGHGAKGGSTRSLLEVIERVCASKPPIADTYAGRRIHLMPSAKGQTFVNTALVQQRAQERPSMTHEIQVARRDSSDQYGEVCSLAPLADSQGWEGLAIKSDLDSEQAEIIGEEQDIGTAEISLPQEEQDSEMQVPAEREIASLKNHSTQEQGDSRGTTKQIGDVDRKLDALSESLGRKLERIAYTLGIRNLNVVDNSADDAEDRRRLMEKLKTAFDNDRLKRFGKTGTGQGRWLEYVFGICKPDQRIGKRGSRFNLHHLF